MSKIVKNDSQREIRVLVADHDMVLAERLVDFLSNNGFYTRYVRNGFEAKNLLLTWKPDFILTDMMLPELNAMEFLKHLGPANLGEGKIRVFVMSAHNHQTNITECFKAGASDWLVKPVKYVDLLSRIVLHAQEKRSLKEPEVATPRPAEPDAQYFNNLMDLVLRESLKNLQTDETLHNLTKMVALAMKAVRVSVVNCDVHARAGYVMGSSDLRNINNLTIDLDKYPEIVYALQSQKLLALDNLRTDATMAAVALQNKSIQFNSIIVAPIRIHATEVWGVLSARMPETRTTLTDSEIRFVQMVSHVIGLVLLKNRDRASGATPLLKPA